MLPTTSQRVAAHTSDHVNRSLRLDAQRRVAQYRNASPAQIRRRLTELEQEWDVERALEANAATACVLGVALGATVDRRWFYFPAVIGGFLLQHAVQGWCPPLPVFRRLGFRTQREIDEERFALKALRGDFRHVSSDGAPDADSLFRYVQK